MAYGEYRRHQEFVVKYKINYPSGKSFTASYTGYSYSEIGAEDIVRYLRKGRNISIISITPTGKFAKFSSYPDNHCAGDR